MRKDFIFTSESVTEGHPDKLCDQISDAIVDHFLEQDPYSKIIAECAVSSAIVFVAARFGSTAVVDFPRIARKVIQRVGYDRPDFNARTCSILTTLKELPLEDAYRFDEKSLSDGEIERIAARNLVTVFGFACNQTDALMPLPIWLAHKLSRSITQVRKNDTLNYLCPEAKTGVGVEYRSQKPYRIHSITITASQKRAGEPGIGRLRDDIMESVIGPVFEGEPIGPDERTEVFINPEGPFLLGGPSVHAGLTGRKTAMDAYGEYARHSGAALSGKGPLRIDRIGAYAARYAAKNLVAAGLADECEVQLSYSITLSRPACIQVETFGTGRIPDEELAALLGRRFDFRLASIMRQFNLRHLPALVGGGFYEKLAVFGQVGRTDMDLPWERTDKATELS